MSAGSGGAVKLYVRNASTSVITRLLQMTVLLWVNQHLLRRIAPSEYCLFPLVVSLMYFAELLKNIVTSGIGRFIVEADAKADSDGVTRIVSSMFPVVLGSALVLGMAASVIASNLGFVITVDPVYLGQAKTMFLLMAGMLCLDVAAAPFTEGAYVRQRFVALNILDLCTEALRIVVLLCLILGVNASVVWLVVASTSANLTNLLVRIGFTRRWMPAMRLKPGAFHSETALAILRFGAWSGIQGITGLVSSTAPALLLNRFGSPLDVASFHLGRIPEMQIRSLASVASAPARPALTRLYAIQGESVLKDLYYRGGRYHLWITLLPIVPFLAFGPEIVRLYAGEQYSSTPAVIIALLGAYPFLWASAMFYQLAHAMGRIRAYYICDTVVQIVALAGMYWAVRYQHMGAPGAGLAVGLAGGIVHVLLVWPMGLRLVGAKWKPFFSETILRGMLPFAAALGVAVAARALIPLDSWSRLGLATAAACATYFFVLMTFCLDSYDRGVLANLLSRARTAGKAGTVSASELG